MNKPSRTLLGPVTVRRLCSEEGGWETCVLYLEGQAVWLSMHSVVNNDGWSMLSGPAEEVVRTVRRTNCRENASFWASESFVESVVDGSKCV